MVRHEGLAALVSEVDLTARLGTPAEAEGRAQYVVKGQYAEQAVLTEVLAELPAAASLAKQIRGKDPDATRQARIRLGFTVTSRNSPSG